ncbi:hypothetical protein B0H10DRAFT_2056958 [Mycena sp. CBHHK59/15]|nr:hypothetical protein B0H10DRAFT_2056958 [Mycena sp. CBHHK59/15]
MHHTRWQANGIVPRPPGVGNLNRRVRVAKKGSTSNHSPSSHIRHSATWIKCNTHVGAPGNQLMRVIPLYESTLGGRTAGVALQLGRHPFIGKRALSSNLAMLLSRQQINAAERIVTGDDTDSAWIQPVLCDEVYILKFGSKSGKIWKHNGNVFAGLISAAHESNVKDIGPPQVRDENRDDVHFRQRPRESLIRPMIVERDVSSLDENSHAASRPMGFELNERRVGVEQELSGS